MYYLFEANYANSGDTGVEIKDSTGIEIEVLYPFNKIFDVGIMKPLEKLELQEKTKQWFNSNFRNWLKNEAPGYSSHDDRFLSEKRFYELLYPDLESTIDDLHDEFPNMSHDEILASFPAYIQKNPKDVKIFAGGRKFRMNVSKFMNMIGELKDYLNAVAQNQVDRNIEILPDAYFVKDLSKLTPVEALKKAFEYHVYAERMASKLSHEQKKASYKALKHGEDFETFKDLEDGVIVVKAKSGKFAKCEGKAMGHCVGTYDQDVESGKTIILAVMKDGVSKATFQMSKDMKTIQQLKGPKNGPVDPDIHQKLQQLVKDEKWKFESSGYGSGDYKHIGLKSGNVEDIKESIADFYEAFSQMLLEADDKPKKTKTKQDDSLKNKFSFKTDKDHLPANAKSAKDDDQPNSSRSQKDLELKKASADATREKMKDVKMDFKSFLHFMNMDLTGLEDKIDPTVTTDMIVKPAARDLPKVINAALKAGGSITPEWHMVKNLPGYMSAGIRAIGRQVFSPFTKTKIEDIQVIANLNDSGPNSAGEINAVAKFLLDFGTKSTDASMEFQDRIPGYKADMKVYTFANYTFLLVKDHAGNYIYSWPSTDNKSTLSDKSLNFLKIGK